MTMNFNTAPYFDDFDPSNNFYKVLFKPGYAVQARELNQLQSILQHQIASMGNHVFKKNSIVIPGGISLNTAADIVTIGQVTDPSVLIGTTITNASNFDPTDDSTLDGYITAVVLGTRSATDTEPAALYVKYFKTQDDGRAAFNPGEEIKTVGDTLITFTVDPTFGASVGKVATISAGTFYTKEHFVDVARQSIIVELSSTTTTNCTIGLRITESVVTADQDDTLLDNANGAPNQYAPGADRYRIELTLARVDGAVELSDDVFIKMMTIENNAITYVNNRTEYAELMKMLARRTYDANGNFIVRGLDTTITEATDDAYVWANVSGGKAYLGGYEFEQLTNTPIALEKPRSATYQTQADPVVTYSSDLPYFYVAGGTILRELPAEDTLVQFLDAAPGTVGATVVGYGIFKDIQYAFGTVGTNDVYKMYFDYVTFERGVQPADIGGIKVITANQGAAVLHEMRLSNVIGTFTAGNNVVPAVPGTTQTGQLFTIVNRFAYLIKNTLNDIPFTETVKDATTGATATRAATFITNYTPEYTPMLEVDSSVVKTLYNSAGDNTTSYSIIRRDSFAVTGTGTLTVTLTGDDVFEDVSTSDYYAYITNSGSEQFIDLTNLIAITNGGKTYELTVGAGSPMIGNTVWVYSTVNKVNVAEATKTQVTVTAGLTIPRPSAAWTALGHQDVVRIAKIVDSQTFAITSASYSGITATIGTAEPHNIVPGDVVVIRGVVSSLNTTGAYGMGYNTQWTVAATPTTTSFTFLSVSDPGGTFNSGASTNAVVAAPPNINTDVDVTSRFTLDTGNTATLSGTGMIKLKRDAIAPAGQLGVQYVYNAISSTGNYVSVDSYGDYTSTDLSYIGDIEDITAADGRTIEARRYIDFRTRPSNYFFRNIGVIVAGSSQLQLRDLNLSGRASTLIGKYVVGPSHLNGATITGVQYSESTGTTTLSLSSAAPSTLPRYAGIYFIGLNGSSLSIVDGTAGGRSFEYPKDSTRISFQCVKFLPKQAMVFIDRNADALTINYREVQNRSEVTKLVRNEYKLPLAYIYMKPYTVSLRDITLEKFENPVYQMLDIHSIRQRVDRTEYYASLALNRDIHSEIVDAQNEDLGAGSRGIWAENFSQPASQDYFSDDFKCTIYDKSYVAPGTVTRTISLEVDDSLYTGTWQRTGTNISLPYTEVRAFGNATASRSNNLNPFNVVNWSGKLTLNPSVDNWVDTTSQPSDTVNNTVVQTNTNVSTTITNEVQQTTPPALVIPVPVVVTTPPPVLPAPQVDEIVTTINVIAASWGPDTAGGRHAITFEWATNLGRRGRVNTDIHLSPVVRTRGFNGAYARSLINRRYNDVDVKEYLNAGTHLDQAPRGFWNFNSNNSTQ